MYTGRLSQRALTDEWIEKTEAFIDRAFALVPGASAIWCPCSRCANRRRQPKDVMSTHLCKNGFTADYTRWIYHGEADRMREEVVRARVEDFDADAGVGDWLNDFHEAHAGEEGGGRRSQRLPQRRIMTCCLRHRNPFTATQRFLNWMPLDG